MNAVLWSLVALPSGAGAVLVCAGRRGARAAPAAGMGVALVTLVLAVLAAVSRPAVSAPLLLGVDAGLAVDGLSAILAVTVAAATFLVLCFAAGRFSPGESRARFNGLMLLFSGAMLVTVTATGLVVLLMAWEVMGAMSWALIGFYWNEPRRVRAANVAFLTTRTADVGLYLAAGAALAGGVGTLSLARLPQASEPWLTLLTAGVVAAALGKSAQLPLHFWLSRAMEGPSAVSALLHSATMVAAGGYLLLRVQPLLAASGWGQPVVAWTGAATALVVGLVAVAQTDLKQLLAASTSAQVGFIVLAAGAGGVAGGAMQLVAHAATKSALFLAAGVWLTMVGTQRLPGLRGAARRHRLVGVAFTVAGASLAGLAPLSLWVTKDQVLAAALQRGTALYAVGLAAAVVAAVYSTKAVWAVWRPELAARARPDQQTRPCPSSRPRAQAWVLVVLAIFAAVLGVLALPPLAQLFPSSASASASAPAAWELALTAVLALGAAALTWRWAGRVGRPLGMGRDVGGRLGSWLADWGRFESLVRLIVVRPVLALARALAAFDDRVLDRLVTAVPSGTLGLARMLRRTTEIRVDGLVHAVAAGTRQLGRLARRPQTGQLHHYYAQAVVALAVLALIAVVVR